MSSTTNNLSKKGYKQETRQNEYAVTDVINSATWQFTNNSGQDVVLIDAFSAEDSALEQLYEQTLAFVKTADHQIALTQDAAKTIALPTVHLDEHNRPQDYTIIVANAQTLFPLKVVELSVAANHQSFPATGVTALDVTISKQAEAFTKTIIAFPSTSLAVDFATALQTGDPDAIAAFFAGTVNYKNLTLDMVVAVQTYYNRFPFFLTDYTAAKTYYLYTSDGTKNKYAGSVALENQAAAFTSMDKATDSFSARYITTNEADYTTLYYQDGQLVDDVDSDRPDYCLQGLFMLRSDITKKEEDNQIILILKGTVNGRDVFGYDQKQERSKEGIYKYLDVLVHPEVTKEWFSVLGVIVAGVVGLALLGVGVRLLFKYLKKAPKMTPAEIGAKNLEIRERNRLNRQAAIDKLGEVHINLPEDARTTLVQIKEGADNVLLNDNKLKLSDTIAQQEVMCNIIDDWANPTSMSRIKATIEVVKGEIDTIDARELGRGTWLKDTLTKLSETTRDLAFNYNQVKGAVRDHNAAFEESNNRITEIAQVINKNEEIRNSIEEEIPEFPEIEE